MAADPLIYCLEQLTDYDQFERLSHDLMALDGYRNIEPLGGSQDKGRDAIHFDRSNGGQATVFAYSVREDWRAKLNSDAAKVLAHGHQCDRFVFLCTSHFTATQRDAAIAHLRGAYGWEIDIYGLERLRTMLTTTHKELVAHHPQIFCPPFFPVAGGLSASECFDHLVIDDADADASLALWLSRRLTLQGYRVWSRHSAPLAGSSVADTIKTLLRTRAFRYLPILSPDGLNDPNLTARRNLAHGLGDQRSTPLVLPIYAKTVDRNAIDRETSAIEGGHFEASWATGLGQVLAALDASSSPRNSDGMSSVVLQSLMPPDVLTAKTETLAANVFPVLRIPDVLNRFLCSTSLSRDEIIDARRLWAFRTVSAKNLISFCPPPEVLRKRFSLTASGGAYWPSAKEMDGIPVYNLVKELLRRSLDVACTAKGLHYCKDRDLFYFPFDMLPRNSLSAVTPDGTTRRVGVCGERTFGVGQRRAKYRYCLAPTFSASWRSDRYEIIVRPRLRITDTSGHLLVPRAATWRRKDIGGTWWNDDWLNRILGVMQFLGSNQNIVVGDTEKDSVEVQCIPQTWEVSTGIDEAALKNAKANRDLVIAREEEQDTDEEESQNDATNAE